MFDNEMLCTHRWSLAELGNLSDDDLGLSQRVTLDRVAKILCTKFYVTEGSLPELDKLGNRKINGIIDLLNEAGEVVLSYFVNGLRAQRMELDFDYVESEILMYEIDFTFSSLSSI